MKIYIFTFLGMMLIASHAIASEPNCLTLVRKWAEDGTLKMAGIPEKNIENILNRKPPKPPTEEQKKVVKMLREAADEAAKRHEKLAQEERRKNEPWSLTKLISILRDRT